MIFIIADDKCVMDGCKVDANTRIKRPRHDSKGMSNFHQSITSYLDILIVMYISFRQLFLALPCTQCRVVLHKVTHKGMALKVCPSWLLTVSYVHLDASTRNSFA